MEKPDRVAEIFSRVGKFTRPQRLFAFGIGSLSLILVALAAMPILHAIASGFLVLIVPLGGFLFSFRRNALLIVPVTTVLVYLYIVLENPLSWRNPQSLGSVGILFVFEYFITILLAYAKSLTARTQQYFEEREQTEKSILEKEAQARVIQRLENQKSDLLVEAAHRLQGPLASAERILGGILDKDYGEIPEEMQSQLAQTLENTERMERLLQHLLSATEAVEHEEQLLLQAIDLADLVRQVCQATEGFARESAVEMQSLPFPDGLRPVGGDWDKLFLALQNIVDNAVRYSPKGGSVTVAISAHKAGATVTVEDTGYGIPAEEQKKVFTKFFRGSNVATKYADGSGLGLFVSKDSIERMGGQIHFESSEGVGTKFSVTLPWWENAV